MLSKKVRKMIDEVKNLKYQIKSLKGKSKSSICNPQCCKKKRRRANVDKSRNKSTNNIKIKAKFFKIYFKKYIK